MTSYLAATHFKRLVIDSSKSDLWHDLDLSHIPWDLDESWVTWDSVSNFLKHDMTQDSKLSWHSDHELVMPWTLSQVTCDYWNQSDLFPITYDLLGLVLDNTRLALIDLRRDPGLVDLKRRMRDNQNRLLHGRDFNAVSVCHAGKKSIKKHSAKL